MNNRSRRRLKESRQPDGGQRLSLRFHALGPSCFSFKVLLTPALRAAIPSLTIRAAEHSAPDPNQEDPFWACATPRLSVRVPSASCPIRTYSQRACDQNELSRGGAWIMMRSATDLSKADLHVFSKLFD